MKGMIVNLSAAALAALAAIPALSAAPLPGKPVAPERYAVTMTIFDAKKIVASPRLIARSNEAATFKTGDGKQIFELVVSPSGGNRFQVQGNLVQWTQTGLISTDANAKLTADGKPRCLTVKKLDAATGKQIPLHIDVTINRV
jgi:hypothetical protein